MELDFQSRKQATKFFYQWSLNLQYLDSLPACQLLMLLSTVRYCGCTGVVYSKLHSHLNHVIGGPLAFEIWKPPGGPLVT